MKKIFLAIVMLAGSLAANAASISLAKTNFDVVAGGTVMIPIQITFDASEANKYKNIEMQAILSDNTNFQLKALETASQQLISGKSYTTKIAGTTITVVGEDPTALINCVSGDFFYLTISADGSLDAGETCTLNLKQALGGDPSYVETDFEGDITATITVVDYVTIDENVEYTPVAMSSKDVHLIRSFEEGKFYTLVLPFACPAAKLTSAFGTAPTVYNFTSVTADNDPIEQLTLTFATSTGLAAHRPYIIKANANTTNPVFTSVAIKTGTPTWAQNEGDFTFEDVVFTGTYAPTTVPAGALYVKSDDAKLYKSQGGTKIKGTRAYMDITALGDVGVKGFVLDLDGVETSIDAIDTDLKAETWFDMNGRKLSNKPMTKGVYVNNGKKVVVK